MADTIPFEVDVANGQFAIIGRTSGLNALASGATAVSGEGSGPSDGVSGSSDSGTGVMGSSDSGTGTSGSSTHGDGVTGLSTEKSGVRGTSLVGASGLLAGTDPVFSQHVGAYGESDQQGVMGIATTNAGTGVYGGGNVADKQFTGIGVRGETFNGTAIQGQAFGPSGAAGRFIGNAFVTGDLHVGGALEMGGADYAEDFDAAGSADVEPGTVVVLDDAGGVRSSDTAYDRRVAGVVSGANGYHPGVILDRQSGTSDRVAVALMGKVYCKVDATHAPIAVGDLLTSSRTAGHAMKAVDPAQAFGAVIGKALGPVPAGRGLVAILVALQ